MSTLPLSKAIQVLFFLFLVFAGLYFAKPFLVPIAFAGLLSMLFLPLSRRLERRGVSRGLATLLCILMLLAVVAGLIALLVLGELVWGVAGMVLAILLLGIVKIICDHIEPLKPYGFLIGENKKRKKSGFMEKVKGWFK